MIIADRREKNSLVLAELIERKAEVRLERLEVADYLVGEVAIERKSEADFIRSMLNKRLLRQLEELKQYPKPLLLIEGLELNELGKLNPNAVRGMLLSVILDFGIPILLTSNAVETAEFLLLLEKKLKRAPKLLSLKPKRKAYSLQEQQRFVLESFPGIGPSLARQLLQKFGSIKEIINAPLSKLAQIKGLGKKAIAMKRIVEANYEE